MNPLIPTAYDVVWTTVMIVVLVALVAALVSIARAAKRLSVRQLLVWTLLAILVPLIGPLTWLFIGRRLFAASTPVVTLAPGPRATGASGAQNQL